MDMIVTQEIEEIIKIQSDEFEEYGLKEEVRGRITWDPRKSLEEKEFDLKKQHTELLKRRAEEMDEKGEWSRQTTPTLLKIEKIR